MTQNYYQLSVNETLKKLDTLAAGLSAAKAAKRLKQYGSNEFSAQSETTAWTIFLNQFKNFFVILLISATALSFFVGEFIDAWIILVVVGINVLIGFFQEYKAETALKALKRMLAGQVTVIRDGKPQQISHLHLVPGDIVELTAGEKVPADIRLIEVEALKVDEAALTGESAAVTKIIEAILPIEQVPDRINLIYGGTLVVAGRGQGVVFATGLSTEFGRIAKLVAAAEEISPLEKRLREIGQWFTLIAIVIGVIVFVIDIFTGADLISTFTFVIALLVAAVPESLPTIVTLSLAIGVLKLAKSHSIVRRLPVVETLGDIDIIATDKTGTLTKNEMTITKILLRTERGIKISEISGVGYDLVGKITDESMGSHDKLKAMMTAATLCNDAQLAEGAPIGDPAEVALLVAAAKAGFNWRKIKRDFTRVDEIPFDPNARFMMTLNKVDEQYLLSTKGAFEVIAKFSKLNPQEINKIKKFEDEFARSGLRVLALAGQTITSNKIPSKISGLNFLGLVGMVDPVRDGVREALLTTEAAGIKTIIITGDHKLTAQAIARQLGMTAADQDVKEGIELNNLSDESLKELVNHVEIYARALPETKLRIIEALKRNGKIVAVTGDGVNDAPALKSAHVGIAMGQRGTDVAKETADLVLLDDSFATIVKSVEFGRGIFDNIRKFITLLLAGNLDEILLVATATLAGWPTPFTTVQILWINLVTDSFPALALGFQPPAPGILNDKPGQRNRGIIKHILSRSILLATIGLVFGIILFMRFFPDDIKIGQTILFTYIVLFELIIVYPLFRDRPIFKSGPKPTWILTGAIGLSAGLQLIALYGPFARYFGTIPLSLNHWYWLGGALLISWIFAETLNIVGQKPSHRDDKMLNLNHHD